MRRATWGVVAIVVAVAFVTPLVLMVLGSLRTPGTAPPRGLELFSGPLSLEAYRAAFRTAPLARSLLNSAIVAAIFVPVAVGVSSLAAFAIATADRRRRARLVGLVLVLFMVPASALWIARFVIFEAAGLVGTWAPLLAPALLGGSPLGVLLYVFAFRRIPGDVIEAARLEGAGPWRVWWSVAMPLARGTTAAVAMLAFVQSWSNLIDPLLYLNDEAAFTAPLALRYLQQLGPTNWPVLLAGSVVVTAPAVAAFILAQRRFLRPERGLGWLA